MKKVFRVLFSMLLVFSIFGVVNVLAEEVIFKITGFSVNEKSDKVTVNEVSLSEGQLINNVEFTYKDDYIKYDITVKNNTSDSYTIKSISDDNTSPYLKYTYDDLSDVKLDAGEEKTFNLTITYIQQVNTLKISDQAVKLTLTYESVDGSTGSEVIGGSDNNGTISNNITNPKTGDNIYLYIILGLVSIGGLVITTVSKRRIAKSVMVIALVSSLIIPFGVSADSDNILVQFDNTINSYRGAGFYDNDDYLISDYDTFVSTHDFEVEEDTSLFYIYEAESDMWIAANYEDFSMNQIDYDDIPDNSMVKVLTQDEYSNLDKIILPDGITKIGMAKFAGVLNISEVVIPDSVEEIGLGAFMTSEMEEVHIPKSIVTLGASAFSYCTNLKEVTFEEGINLETINGGTFDGTSSLEEITIPKSVKTLDEAFFYSGVKKVVFEKGCKVTELHDNLFAYAANLEEINLPDKLEIIGDCSLQNTKIKEITIPATVTLTKNGAFAGCKELETVVFEEGSQFTTLGTGTFGRDSKLKNIVLPDSLITIGYGAFSQCEGLETLTIPASVVDIQQDTFYNNNSLTSVVFENPNGWSRTYGSNAYNPNGNIISISSSDLSNPTTAASRLRNLNLAYNWHRD